MENFDLEVQLEDLMICHGDTSDQSTDTWKTGLELSEDDNLIFSSHNSKLDNRYQVLAITGDNSEELDDNNNNPVLNPANINRGANHLAEGETADSLATRVKVRLSEDEWRTINIVVEHGMPIPTNSSQNMLLGYHYALRQQAKQIAKERIEIQKKKDSAIAASDAARRARSDASYTNRRHHRYGSRYENLGYSERQSISKNLDSFFLSVDDQGNIIPKTPEAALVAAQAYLHTTRPNPGDPREHMHRAALNGLKMVGNKLSAKEEEAYRNKGTHKPRSPRRHNSPRHRSRSCRSRAPSPGRYNSPKNKGTRRSRTPNRTYVYEDDEKEMGAPCFTHRVRITPVPKGFKLPHDQQKYDGSQEPQS
jgi:hypothetical protein